MEVSEDCTWRWLKTEDSTNNDCSSSSSDTLNSMASTIPLIDSMSTTATIPSTSSCSNIASSRRELILSKFHLLMQRWMHLSVIMPSSSCVGIRLPPGTIPDLIIPLDTVQSTSSFPLASTLDRLKLLDKAVSLACSNSSSCGNSSRVGDKRSLLLQQGPEKRKKDATSSSSSAAITTDNEHLWKRLLFGDVGSSSSLKWFTDALGGQEVARKMFANAYLNIQSISKPTEVAEAANNKGTTTTDSKKCPPWALVRLAESDACICCHSAMQVPFKV